MCQLRDKETRLGKSTLMSGTTGSTSRTDLTDFTFLMPLKIDSVSRKENADASIKFIFEYFNTNFIVVEGDSNRKYYPDFKGWAFSYEFMVDTSQIFYKTKYINRLIELSETPYIAVWDADAILPPEQVIASVEELRYRRSIMSIPYDGRVYTCDKYLSDLFKRIHDFRILMKLVPSLPLMYGYHSTGGAFLANKIKYMETGGENENFLGWGPEDSDRVKRFEVKNLPVHRSDGPFFHLWHPRGPGSWYADNKTEIINRREFINTCRNA